MPEIIVDLPSGWSRVGSTETYSPDGGDSLLVLQSWFVVAGRTLEQRVPTMVDTVQAEDMGDVTRTEQLTLPYGPALRSFAGTARHPVAIATLFVPEVHEPLFATYRARDDAHTASALAIVDQLRPDPFAAALHNTVQAARASLAEDGAVSAVGFLIRDKLVTPLPLANLPERTWFDACRHARAQLDAEIVVVVVPGRNGAPTAAVYGESATRHRLALVEGREVRIEPTVRRDLFRAADPASAAALALKRT